MTAKDKEPLFQTKLYLVKPIRGVVVPSGADGYLAVEATVSEDGESATIARVVSETEALSGAAISILKDAIVRSILTQEWERRKPAILRAPVKPKVTRKRRTKAQIQADQAAAQEAEAKSVPCPKCKGKGRIDEGRGELGDGERTYSDCTYCNKTGRVSLASAPTP